MHTLHTYTYKVYTLHTMMYCTFLYYQNQFLLVEKATPSLRLKENVVPVIFAHVDIILYIKQQQILH